MNISPRNRQYISVGCVSVLVALVGIETIIAIYAKEPGRFIQVFGMCILIFVGVRVFQISRRAEAAEETTNDA